MIIITTLTDGRGTISRGRNVGGESHKRIVLGVDRWNILLATRRNGGLCQGGWWTGSLADMEKAFCNMGLDVAVATKIIAEALCDAFDKPRFTEPITLAELDKEFSITRRQQNGWFALYDTFNNKFFSKESSEGDDDSDDEKVTGDKYLPEVKNGTPPIDVLVAL